MTKTTLPHICNNTITAIRAIEKAAKEIYNEKGKIPTIIFLLECSGGFRVQQFMKAYWKASYPTSPLPGTDTPTISIGLADGKQWMEMVARGESVLDGLVR